MRDQFRRKKRGRGNDKKIDERCWTDDATKEQRRMNRRRRARKKARLEQIEVEELMEIESV